MPIPPAARNRILGITALVVVVIAALLGVWRTGLRTARLQASPSPSPYYPPPQVSFAPVSASAAATSSPGSVSASSPSPTASTSASSSPGSAEAVGDQDYRSAAYADAVRQYQLQVSLTSDPRSLAGLWNKIGNSYRENKNADAATSAYDKAISYDATLGDAYLNKAGVLWAAGRQSQARTTLQQGIDAKASRTQDLQNSLAIYNSLGQ